MKDNKNDMLDNSKEFLRLIEGSKPDPFLEVSKDLAEMASESLARFRSISKAQFKVGDKVNFVLEDKYEITGSVTYVGSYYKQIDPTTDKINAKFGYSDKILKKMEADGTIKSASYVGQHAYLDGEIYKIIDNAIEVQFDKTLYYNGIEMDHWTFKEGYIVKNAKK